MTDSALLDLIKKGHDHAFETLFRQYFKVLSVFANRYVQDMDQAQDLVQDVFVKFYEQRNNLEVHSSLKALLYQSVRNKCLDHLRSKQTRTEHHEKILIASQGNDIVGNDVMEELELEEKIAQVIEELPDQCKLIFKMSRLEGKRNAEIAEELNLSKRTVETQISNALKKLRKSLFQYLKVLLLIAFKIFF